jgi:hypothetical protein
VIAQPAYYKVLDDEGKSCNGGRGRWPLPKDGKPGSWRELRGKRALAPCHYGLHLCREADLLYWLGPTIWEAEYEGECVEDGDKVVVRKARILRKIEFWNERTARLFAADCGERALLRERAAGREPEERSWAAITAARAFVRGTITTEELIAARDAAEGARAAAEAAAWAAREAAWAAREAAREVAWKGARSAAWAARGAAWESARGAAWDTREAARAAGDAERIWQTKRLMSYLRGEEPGSVTLEAA